MPVQQHIEDKMGIQSLHSHTKLSDGKLSHLEVLAAAEKAGIEVLAFTDHDFLPDEKILNELKSYSGPVKWLIGIEMSSGLPQELGGGVNGPHVIGLFVDPKNPGLVEYCRRSQEAREERMRKTVINFQELGFDITEEDCLRFTTGATIGQPHIVEALKSKPENLKLIAEFKEKMRIAAESDPQLKQKYDYMKQRGESQEVYMLFMNENSFMPTRSPMEYWEDLDNCAKLIREAGGVISIAHYSYSRGDLPMEIIEKLLSEDRIDGMEIVYGIDSMRTDVGPIFEQDKLKIKELLKKYNKLSTGGSDAHKEEDFYKFADNKDYSSETKGLLEKIIEQKNPDTTYSNI